MHTDLARSLRRRACRTISIGTTSALEPLASRTSPRPPQPPMATPRTAGETLNYVFKMSYDAGGAAPVNRRYSYDGELALPQVFDVSPHATCQIAMRLGMQTGWLTGGDIDTGSPPPRVSGVRPPPRERHHLRPRRPRQPRSPPRLVPRLPAPRLPAPAAAPEEGHQDR